MSIRKIADKHVLLACINNLQISDVEEFVNLLRALQKDIVVQGVNADLVVDTQHVIGILQQSIEAKKREMLLSKMLEIDILLRLACTDQINRAVKDIGLKNGINNVLIIAMGRKDRLEMLRKYLAFNYKINNIGRPSRKKMRFIASFHNIDRRELNAVIKENNKLTSVLIERASLI
ncbi:MAG: KEOPS complex subunit Cgi121 [Nitrososphaerales archaeon]